MDVLTAVRVTAMQNSLEKLRLNLSNLTFGQKMMYQDIESVGDEDRYHLLSRFDANSKMSIGIEENALGGAEYRIYLNDDHVIYDTRKKSLLQDEAFHGVSNFLLTFNALLSKEREYVSRHRNGNSK